MAERPLTTIPNYKNNPSKVFELYREAGRVPVQFTSFEHAGAAFQAALESGLSAQKAREALGLTHKSVAGSYLFGKTPVLDPKKRPVPGKFTYFNPRAINEDIDPTTELYVRRNYGDDAYNKFYTKLNQDWTQFSELERRHVQGLTGKQFHRGHGWAASARGGSVSQNNMYAEHGQRNVLHASGDRWPDAVMRDLGIPKNNMEAFYADPNRNRLRTSHAVAMDDDWTAMNPDGKGFHRRPGSVNPFNAEILSDKLDQLEAQGLSREGIDRALMERSATLSQSNSVSRSGPVRTTRVDPRAIKSVNAARPTRAQLEAQRKAVQQYGIPAPKPESAARPEQFESALHSASRRMERRLGRGVFDTSLDVNSETYIKNIASMQPFLDLSDDQKAAINLYGQDGKQFYAQLNRLLRAGDPKELSSKEISTLKYIQENLTGALDSLPFEPTQVYRGVSGAQVADLANLKVGDFYVDKGFGSFSNDESAARRFLSRDKPSTLVSVSNSSARNITPIAEYSETEFLSKPNTRYTVAGIEETINAKTNQPIRLIKLTEVANSPQIEAKAAQVAASQYGIPPKALAALGLLPAVGALLDAGDSIAGTHQAITGKSKGDQLAGVFQAIGGVSGLASLSPAAPVAAPISMAANGLAMLTQRRADMDKPKTPKPLYGAPVTARIVPTTPPRSKPIGSGKGGVSKPVGGKPKPANKPTNKPLDLGNEARYWGRRLLGIRF